MNTFNIYDYLHEKTAAAAWRAFFDGSATHPPVGPNADTWDRMAADCLAKAKTRGGELYPLADGDVPEDVEGSIVCTVRHLLDKGYALVRAH